MRLRRKLKRSRLLKGGVKRIITSVLADDDKNVAITTSGKTTNVRRIAILGPCKITGNPVSGEFIEIETEAPIRAFGWPRKRKSRRKQDTRL